jgi:PadR family transcriptional regulator, regulatory protein PadR
MSQIEIILLSLLYEKNCYGYEIESIIKQRHIREWTEIGFSSIYSTLGKLEKKGMVEAKFEKENGSPSRKVYFLKGNAGEMVLAEIKEALSTPKSTSCEFTIGMAFSYLLSQEEVIEALQNYKNGLEERRRHIVKRFSEQPAIQNTPYIKALFTRPLKTISAEIEWLEELFIELSVQKGD